MSKKGSKAIIIFFSIVLTVVLVALTALFIARLFLATDDGGKASAANKKNEDTTSMPETEDKYLNVLMLGSDEASGLYDMMMIMSYNMTQQSVSVVQIPRDTYLEYTSGNYRKINGAIAALGGEKQFCEFLSDAMCISIDNYFSIDLDAMGEIVDVLGGIEINIPFDMNYDDPEQALFIHLKKGKTMLDGDMARQFVRYRSGYTDGDVGRIDAQKIFLAALVNKLKSDTSFFELTEVITSVIDDVKTDMSISNIISLARQAFSIQADKIRFVTLAGEGTIASKSGASYYVISCPAAIRIVNEFLGARANSDNFDKDRLFLNERYDSFGEIYYRDIDFQVYDANSLVSYGIEISHK